MEVDGLLFGKAVIGIVEHIGVVVFVDILVKFFRGGTNLSSLDEYVHRCTGCALASLRWAKDTQTSERALVIASTFIE